MRTLLFAAAAALLGLGLTSGIATVRAANDTTHVATSYIVAQGMPAAVYRNSQAHPQFAQGLPANVYSSSQPHPRFAA